MYTTAWMHIFYVQQKAQSKIAASLSQSTKAATYMFLSYDAKSILHDGHGRISWETQPVEACVRRW